MFAVIKDRRQAIPGCRRRFTQVEKVKGEPGEIVTFGEGAGGRRDNCSAVRRTDGLPVPSVAPRSLEQGRGEKVIAFKKRTPQETRAGKRGTGQEFTLLRVTRDPD